MRKYENCSKLTDQEIAEMHKLRDEGMSYCKLAERFNLSLSSIQWRIGPERTREGARRRARQFYHKHKEEVLAKSSAWNRVHKDKQYRSICFSQIRLCLKRGYISKADVLDVLGEFENG